MTVLDMKFLMAEFPDDWEILFSAIPHTGVEKNPLMIIDIVDEAELMNYNRTNKSNYQVTDNSIKRLYMSVREP